MNNILKQSIQITECREHAAKLAEVANRTQYGFDATSEYLDGMTYVVHFAAKMQQHRVGVTPAQDGQWTIAVQRERIDETWTTDYAITVPDMMMRNAYYFVVGGLDAM